MRGKKKKRGIQIQNHERPTPVCTKDRTCEMHSGQKNIWNTNNSFCNVCMSRVLCKSGCHGMDDEKRFVDQGCILMRCSDQHSWKLEMTSSWISGPPIEVNQDLWIRGAY